MIVEVKEACNPEQQRLIDFVKTTRFVPKPDWLEKGEGKIIVKLVQHKDTCSILE